MPSLSVKEDPRDRDEFDKNSQKISALSFRTDQELVRFRQIFVIANGVIVSKNTFFQFFDLGAHTLSIWRETRDNC